MEEMIDFFDFALVERPEANPASGKASVSFLRMMCSAGSILHTKNPPMEASFVV